MSKSLKIFFAVSVLLNVLLIGLLIGTFSHPFMARLEMRMRAVHFMKDLPPEKREMVLAAMKELRSETAGTKKEISIKRNEIIDVFTAPVFDPNKFDQKVAELHVIMGELVLKIADSTKKIAGELSPQERKALGEAIRRSPGPPFPHHFIEEEFREHGPNGSQPPPPNSEGSRD